MLKLEKSQFSDNFIYLVWFLMSFQAGYINVGGFLIFGNYVSHVTGTSSQIGMRLANFNSVQLLTFTTILCAFILGSAFASFHISRRIDNNLPARYIRVSFIKCVLFGIILFLSEVYFSGHAPKIKLAIIFLLSFCCGIQNATCSQATNGFLKPTHMTGLSTELGISLGRLIRSTTPHPGSSEDWLKTKLRFTILAFFIFGGVVAMLIFGHNDHLGFIFPFVASFALLCVAIASEMRQGKMANLGLKLTQSAVWGVFLLTIFIAIYHYVLMNRN